MKRVLALLAVLLLLAFSASASNVSTMRHVADEANKLTPAEEADLEEMARALYADAGFDVIVHTTNNSQGKTPMDYSFDYYHAFRDAARYPNGALLAVMYDTRDYYEAARGTGIELLTKREAYDLGDVVQSRLTEGDEFGAFRNYIRYVRRVVIPPTPIQRVIELAPFVLIGGLVIGLVYALILKGKLNIARFASGAAAYVVPGSLNLTESNDIYLYQTVTRTRIQTNTSGRGGGGGFSTGSRGGVSYGGRGGKF